MNTTYQLTAFDGLLTGSKRLFGFVRDGAEPSGHELYIKARVQSGDYFVTLATDLDTIARNLSKSNPVEAEYIEDYVKELLFIDKNYRITRK